MALKLHPYQEQAVDYLRVRNRAGLHSNGSETHSYANVNT